MPLKILTIPCLADNYAFILHDKVSGQTAVVDAPDAAPIRKALTANGMTLTHIFLTHHHWDHIQGVEELRVAYGAEVYGARADAERLPALDVLLTEDDTVALGNNTGTVIDVPGHTVGHIAYFFADSHAMFTGDSLMAMGCGRLFEGTPAQMWSSLSKLAALPPETMVYSGHEYTQANARFAQTIDPDNMALQKRIQNIEKRRAAGQPTVPSALSDEVATNPFLQAPNPRVKAFLGMESHDDTSVFAKIRQLKDSF